MTLLPYQNLRRVPVGDVLLFEKGFMEPPPIEWALHSQCATEIHRSPSYSTSRPLARNIFHAKNNGKKGILCVPSHASIFTRAAN